MTRIQVRSLLAGAIAPLFATTAVAGVPAYDTIELQARSNLIVNDNGWNVPPGTSFNSISAAINDAQQVAFTAGVVPIDGNLSDIGAGLWVGGHGVGEFVAIHDPGSDPKATMIISDRPSINEEGHVASDHGGPVWPLIRFYHNSVVRRTPTFREYFLMGLGAQGLRATESDVFNNIFVQFEGVPGVN